MSRSQNVFRAGLPIEFLMSSSSLIMAAFLVAGMAAGSLPSLHELAYFLWNRDAARPEPPLGSIAAIFLTPDTTHQIT